MLWSIVTIVLFWVAHHSYWVFFHGFGQKEWKTTKCRKIQKNTENQERKNPQHIDTKYTTTATIESSHFFDQQSIDNCKAFFVLHCKYLTLFRYTDVYHWIATIPEIKKKGCFFFYLFFNKTKLPSNRCWKIIRGNNR